MIVSPLMCCVSYALIIHTIVYLSSQNPVRFSFFFFKLGR